jgi:hypothetical protein
MDIKAEVTGVIFEVPARFARLSYLSQPNTRTILYDYAPPLKVAGELLDDEGHPPPEMNGLTSSKR